MKSGNGKYVLMPADWVKSNCSDDECEVIVEVYEKYITILPYKG